MYISLYCQESPYPQEVPLRPPPPTPVVTTVLPVHLDSVSQPPNSVTSPLSVQMDQMSPFVVCKHVDFIDSSNPMYLVIMKCNLFIKSIFTVKSKG